MIVLTEEAYEALALADKIVAIANEHNWTNWIVGGVADSRMVNKLRMDLLDKDEEISNLKRIINDLKTRA